MRKIIPHLTIILFMLCSYSSPSLSCTDFRLTGKDGTVIVARSLEFAEDLNSNLRSSPRERLFNMSTVAGQPGLSWKAKYGYVYLDGANYDAAVDGLNEQGLSFEYLYLPGETQYPSIPAGKTQEALPYIHFGDWILSNFKTIAEVREALPKIYVYAEKISALGNIIYPLHAAIYEASGKGIVVEFVNGKMQVYDNQIGVMTNSPTYNWQLTNLRNYVNLTPYTPQPIIDHKILFAATGQGAGMVGLPGDVSPPSRFVKTAIMLATVIQPIDVASTLNVAQHIMNNFDIPLGFVREEKTGNAVNELTQWVVFKDLTHKVLYFRSYDNLNLQAVSLSQINFSANAPLLKMPIKSPTTIQDVTADFINQAPAQSTSALQAGSN